MIRRVVRGLRMRPLPMAVALTMLAAGFQGGCSPQEAQGESADGVSVLEESRALGGLEFRPGAQEVRVEPGTKEVPVTFGVSNTGKSEVMVTKLESSCSCLSVTIDKETLAPGDSATITGVFATGKLLGETEKLITVKTSELPRETVKLKVALKIDPLYEITEEMTTWKVGEPAEPKVVRFEVKRDKPIRILSATSMRKEVRCELKTVEEGRVYELTLTPDSTDRNLLGIVRIETDLEIEDHARPLAYFAIK